MDLLITGMDCSGVDHLSELIDGYENCVVREPTPRVLAGLAFPLPWPLAIYYRLERIRLLEADLSEADRLTDSRAFDAIGDAEIPPALGEDLVLATASTHPYLARLDTFEKILPDARVVVCVRDPYDTIAAWKRCDPARPINELARSWQEFAQLILSCRHRLILVNYADLEREPDVVLERVLNGRVRATAPTPRLPRDPATPPASMNPTWRRFARFARRRPASSASGSDRLSAEAPCSARAGCV